MESVKALAIMLAAICMTGTLVAALLSWFLATGPFENATPENTRPFYDLLMPIAVSFVFAVLTLCAVALDRRQIALVAFALHAGATGFVLVRALRISDQNDGKLIAFTLAVEASGLSALVLGMKARPVA